MVSRELVPSLKACALRMLALREHSRDELRKKLLTKTQDRDEVELVLDRMIEVGLQSDVRFAEAFLRSKAARMGADRLLRELQQRGISKELALAAMDDVLDEDEWARAHALWLKKFGELPQGPKEWARQARYLQSRGFAVHVIRKLLKEPFDESA